MRKLFYYYITFDDRLWVLFLFPILAELAKRAGRPFTLSLDAPTKDARKSASRNWSFLFLFLKTTVQNEEDTSTTEKRNDGTEENERDATRGFGSTDVGRFQAGGPGKREEEAESREKMGREQ